MDNPSDEAIAEALRLRMELSEDAIFNPTPQRVWELVRCGDFWAKSIMSHARTIDQRNKLVEALERIGNTHDGHPLCCCDKCIATQTLTQIRSGQ